MEFLKHFKKYFILGTLWYFILMYIAPLRMSLFVSGFPTLEEWALHQSGGQNLAISIIIFFLLFRKKFSEELTFKFMFLWMLIISAVAFSIGALNKLIFYFFEFSLGHCFLQMFQ